jgi:hypothetical protein
VSIVLMRRPSLVSTLLKGGVMQLISDQTDAAKPGKGADANSKSALGEAFAEASKFSVHEGNE